MFKQFETSFDDMISRIEEWAGDKYVTTEEIVQASASSIGLSLRSAKDVFRVVTGLTLRQYINERKMMAAYRHLIYSEKLDISGAYEIYGSGGHQAFDKSFKNYFGMTPTQAFERKDESHILEPLFMSTIDVRKELPTYTWTEEMVNTDTIFGLPSSRYEEIVEASDLMALYDLDVKYGNIAFDEAHKHNWELKDAFRFVSDIRDLIAILEEPEEDMESQLEIEGRLVDKETFCRYWVNDPTAQFFFFTCDISTSYAYFQEDFLPGGYVLSLEPKLIHAFSKRPYNFSFGEFENIYQYYVENAEDSWTDSDWEDYLDLVWEYCSPERALDEVSAEHWSIDDDCFDLDSAEPTKSRPDADFIEDFEKWAKENMGSSADTEFY